MSAEEIKKSTSRSVHYIRNIYKRMRFSLEDVIGMRPREKELALQNLEQSEMWAVRAVYKQTSEEIAKEKSNASESTTVSHSNGNHIADSDDVASSSKDRSNQG